MYEISLFTLTTQKIRNLSVYYKTHKCKKGEILNGDTNNTHKWYLYRKNSVDLRENNLNILTFPYYWIQFKGKDKDKD